MGFGIYVGELDWLRFQGVWDDDFRGHRKTLVPKVDLPEVNLANYGAPPCEIWSEQLTGAK